MSFTVSVEVSTRGTYRIVLPSLGELAGLQSGLPNR